MRVHPITLFTCVCGRAFSDATRFGQVDGIDLDAKHVFRRSSRVGIWARHTKLRGENNMRKAGAITSAIASATSTVLLMTSGHANMVEPGEITHSNSGCTGPSMDGVTRQLAAIRTGAFGLR